MPGICERCLKIYREAAEYKSLVCQCSHETDYNTAASLYQAVWETGKRLVGGALKAKIKNRLKGIDGTLNVGAVSRQIEFSPDHLYDGVKIDASSCVDPGDIEAVGIKVIEMLIRVNAEELESIIDQAVDQIVAAKVIAHLYDGKTGFFPFIDVQKVPGSGINTFFLGDNILDPAARKRAYGTLMERVLIVIGSATKEDVRATSTQYATRLSNPSCPLAVIYRADEPERSGLFIYL